MSSLVPLVSHSVKLCALAAQAFLSQQRGTVTRMWRSCQVQLSQKEGAICEVRSKKGEMLMQPLSWDCIEYAIHHERDMGAMSNTHSNNRVISLGHLYWCLLPHCEALRTWRSGFPITVQEMHFLVFCMPNK